MADKISVNVKMIDGKVFILHVASNEKVSKVKEILEEQALIPANLQRLIYSGHVLDDQKTLVDYGIEEGHSLHVVRSKPTSSSQTTSQGMESNRNSGIRGSGSDGLNTNYLERIMGSPMISSLLQNEDLVRSLIENHPQIQTLIETNPELGHILSDPATTTQMMQMMQNPNLMREMQRNTDLAISNLENHPEGFRALRDLYQTLEEPLNRSISNILENPEENEPSVSVPPSNETLTSPNTTALPNPWASSPFRVASVFERENADNRAFNVRGGTEGDAGARSPLMGSGGGGGGFDYAMGSLDWSQMDLESILQLTNNPIFRNMFQSVITNPQLLQSLVNNQLMQDLLVRNPHLNSMIGNPEFLRSLAQINQNLASTFPPNNNSSNESTTATGGTPPAPGESGGPGGPGGSGGGTMGTLPTNMTARNWEDLSNMISQMLIGGGRMQNLSSMPNVPQFGNATNQPSPSERFAEQLNQLKDMGFYDEAANISALTATNGNVSAAVDRLLNNPY